MVAYQGTTQRSSITWIPWAQPSPYITQFPTTDAIIIESLR